MAMAMSPHFHGSNSLTLLDSGAQYFPALLAAIDAARLDIHLETYIFANDATGSAVASALIRAAQRGVTVRVVVDGFGGRDFPASLMPELQAAGVHVQIYRAELAPLSLRRRRLRRLHRKLAVIDGRIAFIGGINVIDDGNSPLPESPRHDYAVRVSGPLLRPIVKTTRRMWEIVSWANFKRRLLAVRPCRPMAAPAGTQRAALVLRDNLLHRRDIEEAYLAAITAAHTDILIANAYFLPGARFRHALVAAARRGVRVRLLLQGRVEYRLQHYATQALYGSLMASGIRIFEYHRSFMHAKVAVIDDQWATVGSSNIDPFSLLLAKEANVVVDDARFARDLRAHLEGAMQEGARELLPARWRQLPLYSRLLRWASYQSIRLLLGIAGYAQRHDRA